MEQPLQHVAEEHAWTKSNPHSLNGIHNRTDNVGTCLKAVWPDEVHEVHHTVLAPKPSDAESKMLHNRARCLPMHEVAIGKGVLKHGDDGVDVVGGLRADVLEDEGERLQAASADI